MTFGSRTAACANTSKLARNEPYGWCTSTSPRRISSKICGRSDCALASRGGNRGDPRLVLQLRAVDARELQELGQVERALHAVDLRLVRLEPALEPRDHLGRRGRAHLDPDDVAEATSAKLALHGLEEVGRVVGDLEVGVARHPEDRALDDLDTGEERRQEVGDDLLERDVQAATAELEEAREALGDLHAREALLAHVGILREDREREREPRDVGERLAGADRERREHGIDLALEALLELRELLRPEILDAADRDPLSGERGTQLALPEPRLQRGQLEDALADPRERLLWREPVRRANRDPRLGLPEQTGDANLEELVEVRGEDRAELHALEERQRLVGRELENASMELEVRELAVEQSLDGLGADFRRHRTIVYRQRALWGKYPVNTPGAQSGGRPWRAPGLRVLPASQPCVRSLAEAGRAVRPRR